MKNYLFTCVVLWLTVFIFSSWSYHITDEKTVTHHRFLLDGKQVDYEATTGYTTLTNEHGQPIAKIFYTAYTNLNTPGSKRPVTFVFNGGPGSASLWLHMGSFAPVRVNVNYNKSSTSLNDYQYGTNPSSWLGFTDLVFIDPVSTGYSRAADGIDPKIFYGYDRDISSIGQFIQRYIDQNNRQESTVFMAGESYGAARAVGLTGYLQKKGIAVSGLTLISPALNYQVLNFNGSNVQAFIHYLPTYAVTAQYHRQLTHELQKLSTEALFSKASFFATHSYAAYLNQTSVASGMPKVIVDSLVYFTGLSRAIILKLKGKITDNDYMLQLLRSQNKLIGCFDSRFTGPETSNRYIDPSETNIRSLFVSTFDHYVHHGLAYHNTVPYQATINLPWDIGTAQVNGYLNVSQTLKTVMINNPKLKVNVVCGYYDLSTPMSATEYVVAHMNLPAQLRSNIAISTYNSGHMIYISAAANAKFKTTGQRFYFNTIHS